MKKLLTFLKKLLPSVIQIVVLVLLVLTAFLAYNLGARHHGGSGDGRDRSGQTTPEHAHAGSSHPVDEDGDGIIYISPMHPHIQQDEPGNCPICGMELVPVNISDLEPSDAGDQDGHQHADEPDLLGFACAMNCVPPLEEPGSCPICGMEMQPVFQDKVSGEIEGDPNRRLTLSNVAKALASIQTSPVEKRVPERTIRLFGELAIDPSRRSHISADVGGRIDKLEARYVGDFVEKGQEIVLLYSPELLAVQQDFLQAISALNRLPVEVSEAIRRGSENAVSAGRERLRLAGLSTSQIDELMKSGRATEQILIHAKTSGTVMERYFEEGDYVPKGGRILTIVDLEGLWAELAAYESDLSWLQVGQRVELTSEVFPGDILEGEISWLDPVSSMRTRTTRVRVDIKNEDGKLRPGMYVIAHVHGNMGKDPQLIIPESAPLITGTRAVVYVEVPGTERPTFQGVEVVLGHRVTDGYIVREGLEEGQRVVTNGSFQIDSALQIIARPSMMSPEGGVAMDGHAGHGSPGEAEPVHDDHESPPENSHPGEFHPGNQFDEMEMEVLITDYLHLQRALAQDDFAHARHGWSRLASNSGNDLPIAADIQELRVFFKDLSDYTIDRFRGSGEAGTRSLKLVHCPMAFDFIGADWLQATEEVRNPYFGAEMLTCGTVEQEWSGHD